VFGVTGQVTALTVLVASVAVVYAHRHTLFQEVTR
jgi:hypothetical protein